MRISMEQISTPLCMSVLFSILICLHAIDGITETQSIADGNTIISSNGSFEMGFFSPGNSNNRYFGIWYNKVNATTVVWVANREIPLTDKSGVLKVRKPGILVLLNSTNQTIWSSNTSSIVQNPVAQLLESGNLVVRNSNNDSPRSFLWQSFDYPGNTLLPGMKFGKNFLSGHEWCLSSWKSDDDPAQGDYRYGMDTHGYPQLILRRGIVEKFRSGPWNGLRFSGSSIAEPTTIFKFDYVFNEEELYYSFEPLKNTVFFRRVLTPDGNMQRWAWRDQRRGWFLYSSTPSDNCDSYAVCGAYGSCKIGTSQICGCLNKFVPRYPKEWDQGDWSKGCVRRKPLACHDKDGFVKYSRLKLPDTRNSWYSINMTLVECRKKCFENCSCTAYANLDIRSGGSGCLLWFGDLIDLREFMEEGQDVYVKMASSELEEVDARGKRKEIILVSSALAIAVVLLCLSLSLYIMRKKRKQLIKKGMMGHLSERKFTKDSQKEDIQLPLFKLATITSATNNFSVNNKLGEGGYGPVYKGMLEGGQEIAVKRLSRNSRQGLDEFKNEVICIAKLQHRNLVKLLGCCIQGEEKMLIYEYMPNKSLDFFIFDKNCHTLLDWPKRFHIINGISRGLLYLHQDSRLRIIHRDLKASNVLLDIDMNPKISDFGMARTFGGNETEANTSRVVGTYGYMSPEYIMDGIFSMKSDVFSFGVMVMEIVCGKRNRGFLHFDHNLNLLGHAWKLYNEGKALELVDSHAIDSRYELEMLRSIHVALLCVQQCSEDRPSMSAVVVMLSGEGTLPQPKQPGFYTERNPLEVESSTSRDVPCSANELTITLLDAR